VSVLALLGAACASSAIGVADAAGAPVNASPPSISGAPLDGQVLKAVKGSWSGHKPIEYAYQWVRCDAAGGECEDIASAKQPALRVSHEDVGHTLGVAITAIDASGSSTASSALTALVAPLAVRKRATPKIEGAPEDGQVLSVGGEEWKGTPPLSFAYQWEVCDRSGADCSVIVGATDSSYRVVSSQIGSRLRAIVTASNAGGSAVATSRATEKIAAGPPVSIAPPAIAGSLQEGQTLTANVGSWAGTAPFVFSSQWQRCSIFGGSCEDIHGATSSTYTLEALDIASQLAVVVTASNAEGSASATSAETSPILALLPTNILSPAISGLLREGQVLSVGAGSWSGTQPIDYSYQWQLCGPLGKACADISEATGTSLKLSLSDIGDTVDVIVKATNVAGSSSATTPVTEPVEGIAPTNTVLPSVTGVLKDGQVLTANAGTWSGTAPISYSYQWQLCNLLGKECANIAKATGSTYLLGLLDVGLPLRVAITATNVTGSASATSNATGLIEGLL
jgi:hypothetical protein